MSIQNFSKEHPVKSVSWMTEISFKVKDDPMNFMQRFPSLKYQDRRDKKFASKRDDPIMKSHPKTT